jgi:hypothetical protein
MQNKDETIGYHKGCLSTLLKEREELVKLVNITEQLINIHAKALKELGVELQTQNDK